MAISFLEKSLLSQCFSPPLLQGQAIDPSKKQTNLFITEDTLIIRSVSQTNNGVYQCLAKNQVGQGVSNTQTVNVKGK